MSSPEHKQKIWNLIKEIGVGMLVTQDEGTPRARPMHLVQDAYDGTLWFYTKKSAEKAFEAQSDRDVCITFSDQEEGVYVSMSGKARLRQDSEIIDKYWNSLIAAWFDGGREDPDIAVMEIDIRFGEHWKSKESKAYQLYEIARSNINEDHTPNVGENEKFGH